ncbi:MAG: protease modulator HflC [Gammaproteobacteria bacterium]|nr:protease modulator HflC [Gammaproteobacteria bacterium]
MGASVKTIVIIVVLVILGALALDAFYIVDERQRAIVLRFGELTSGEGGENPGLHFKLPIADEVKYFDARVLTMDTPPQRYYTSEKKPLIVDSFVKWRVGDPPLYYTATSGEEETANGRLQDRVNEGLRNQIGRRTMHDVISGERDQLMQELTNDLNRVMLAEFGIAVLDVRVKKIDLPPEVSAAVFDRMNSERAIEARQYRAGGTEIARGITATADRESVVIEAEAYKEAEQIRGDGDAEAARIYAEAYNQDPDFYEFYRSINAYRTVFSDGNSLLVLDPSSEFFKYLKSDSGN